MTPIQIASNVIEKLQEENRIALETLRKCQSNIKYLERQLVEKEQLIKILEDRYRTGTNSYLEMSNKQKELTIKHLELQIQKLFKENKELEQQIADIQYDICAKCEMKQFFGMPIDNKHAIKSTNKKVTTKGAKAKSTAQAEEQNREKMLQRIIEHKDRRISHLLKEVQRLTQSEKEFTNKIYRLTKLIPLSHMPSEVLTECLLKEIQSLESQIQLYKGGSGTSISNRAKSASLKSASDKVSFKNKRKEIVCKDVDDMQHENAALVSNLHKLYNDVSDLKRLFALENEKLYQSLTSDSLRNDVLKIQWKEIISRLNDIAESIKSIITVNPNFKNSEQNISNETENIILCLQDRLKDSLELATQYENENVILKEDIIKLKDELMQKKSNSHVSENQSIQLHDERITPSTSLKAIPDKGDSQHLKSLLNLKEKQLDSAESHLKTCQKFIQELQHKSQNSENLNVFLGPVPDKKDVATNTDYQREEISIKSLLTKLEVAEKNIKACEGVIEGLQKMIQNLEEENIKLESDLHMAKFKKILSDNNNNHTACLKSKLKDAEDEMTNIHKEKKDLKTKVHFLEAENSSLKKNLEQIKNEVAALKVSEEENILLQSKLKGAEKQIESMQINIKEAQSVNEKLRQENNFLQIKLQSTEKEKAMSRAHEDDIMSLRNQLILKEDEIYNLKESLHAFECKAYEMNHYRKTLREEIEKLCDVLLDKSENSNSAANRKAIYKAAILRSAQALLHLDDDFNFQSEDKEKHSALEELKRQVSVYLTEVSRIHELLTIKEQQREDLLRQYLDLNGQTDIPKLESSHELHFQEDAPAINLSGIKSSAESHSSSSSHGIVSSTSESGIHSASKNIQTDASQVKQDMHPSSQPESILKTHIEELEASKSITTYLLSKCSQLEDLLENERTEHAKCEKDVEILKNTIKELKSQVNIKSNIAKRLNTLIEMMRSKECNDEITVEQLKSEIKWLVDENQKVFEKITATQSELSRCKEENARIQNDLDCFKRQLVNEKYEHAKVNNELKHLRLQISQSSTLNGS
ncbi:uncharacterized protein CDAR_124261 [Caerostris darwini]|uniref:Uncharacterized protein n=1 Tax=Caerostris darwini TaxID=1538125 RepID=A0AAV4R822_9ARAC|nr:uncharacterized protein CDAR_124261 [Caerostris darwini]